MTREPAGFAWSRIAVPAFGPQLLAAAAVGAITPVLAIRAHELGAGITGAGVIIALLGLGKLAGALPAGAFVARFGERRALTWAGVGDIITIALAGFVPHLWAMGAAVFASGFVSATFFLARQSYMIDVLPPGRMARGMSMLGGTMRMGLFVGPAAGGALVRVLGTQGAYWAALGFAVLSLVVIVASPDLTGEHERDRADAGGSTWRTLVEHRRVLLTLGLGVVVISALREIRFALLPLWAVHIGLDAQQSSLVFVVAGFVEMLMFYPGGWAMDRLGRRSVVLPLTLILSVCLIVLPLADTLNRLIVVAMAMAIGNGLGSGVVMTMGADVAPDANRARFLGGWRLMGELGNAGGPVLLTILTAALTLGAASVVLGVGGLLGAVHLGYWVGRLDRLRVGSSTTLSTEPTT
ncbi:MFS transporter [Kribbia dieselivorans]|uniref:MFS transporter n=1 Tax=Kribbia dieselivorans TaxID=331526 RepID=UPI000837BE6E|nr:MFS transporter [Kribbia dieselivorans]